MQIECKHVSKTIHHKTILQDIDLKLESGTVYGLWGKNGSGKTMLMRLLAGLIRPTEGEVWLNGVRMTTSFPESMGLLIENPVFLPGYTGFDNLKLLADIKGTASEGDLKNALERVGLDPEDTRPFQKYSLGMKQRLGIACAIMEKPELILLDEPINALDVKGAGLIRNLLHEEKERGALVVVSCHDADEMNSLADRIYTIEDGRIKTVSEKAGTSL